MNPLVAGLAPRLALLGRPQQAGPDRLAAMFPGLHGNMTRPVDPERERRTTGQTSQIDNETSARQTQAMSPEIWQQAVDTTRGSMPKTYRKMSDDVDKVRDGMKGLYEMERHRGLLGGVDLSPLAALNDSWFGTDLQKGYKGAPIDKTIGLGLSMADLIAKGEGQLTAAEMNALKMNLSDFHAQQYGLRDGASNQFVEGVSQGMGALGPLIADARAREFEAVRQRERAEDKETALSPAQRAVDTRFAQEYADYVAKGGYAHTQRQIQQLRDARRELELLDKQGSITTGPWTGNIPEKLYKMTAPEATAIEQNVKEVVQNNLRLILGGQFSERQGQDVLDRAYDRDLPLHRNLESIDRLLEQMEEGARGFESAAQLYEQEGTLRNLRNERSRIPERGDKLPSREPAGPLGQSGVGPLRPAGDVDPLEAEIDAIIQKRKKGN